jgi:hypothetical protein
MKLASLEALDIQRERARLAEETAQITPTSPATQARRSEDLLTHCCPSPILISF